MNNRLSGLVLWIAAFTAAMHASVGVHGEELPTESAIDDRQAAAAQLLLMESLAKACQLSRDATAAPYQLETKPLLRWSNPVSGVEDGALWLWTHEGRPVATLDVFSVTQGRTWSHQWQSLSEVPFLCQHDGQVRWSPQSPGSVFQPLPNAPKPALTAAGRLIQMRALARAFTVEDDFKTQFRGAEFNTHELRLLAQPLYRYSHEGAGIEDGALFAYVLGTACEALLMLEFRDQNGRKEWHYGLTGQTCYEVRAKLNGNVVWSQPCWDDAFDIKSPFFAFSTASPK